MSVHRERLDALWAAAEKSGNEDVLDLIDEIDRLKHELGCRNRIVEGQTHKIEALERSVEKAARKKFRQGQAYMRDRAVLALYDEGMHSAAALVQGQNGQNLPDDLASQLRDLSSRLKEIHSELSSIWKKEWAQAS